MIINEKEGTGHGEHDETGETGLGNRQSMGCYPIRELVGGTTKGGRILATITQAYLGTSGGCSTPDRRNLWNKKSFLGFLKTAAIRQGTWIDDVSSLAFNKEMLGRGFESDIYLSKDKEHVIKVNNLSSTPMFDEFIERLITHNKLFRETLLYKIIGFAYNRSKMISVVLEQPYVKDPFPATEDEIDKKLREMGFVPKLNSSGEIISWLNHRYKILDARPRNVLKGGDGVIYFIDVIVEPLYGMPFNWFVGLNKEQQDIN